MTVIYQAYDMPAWTYRLGRRCRLIVSVSGTPHLLSDIIDNVRLSIIPVLHVHTSALIASSTTQLLAPF